MRDQPHRASAPAPGQLAGPRHPGRGDPTEVRRRQAPGSVTRSTSGNPRTTERTIRPAASVGEVRPAAGRGPPTPHLALPAPATRSTSGNPRTTERTIRPAASVGEVRPAAGRGPPTPHPGLPCPATPVDVRHRSTPVRSAASLAAARRHPRPGTMVGRLPVRTYRTLRPRGRDLQRHDVDVSRETSFRNRRSPARGRSPINELHRPSQPTLDRLLGVGLGPRTRPIPHRDPGAQGGPVAPPQATSAPRVGSAHGAPTAHGRRAAHGGLAAPSSPAAQGVLGATRSMGSPGPQGHVGRAVGQGMGHPRAVAHPEPPVRPRVRAPSRHLGCRAGGRTVWAMLVVARCGLALVRLCFLAAQSAWPAGPASPPSTSSPSACSPSPDAGPPCGSSRSCRAGASVRSAGRR